MTLEIFIYVLGFRIFFGSAVWMQQIKGISKITAEKEEARIKPVVELAAKTVQKVKDRCSYGWVMHDLTVSI
ncbi:hypothetical protein OROMI_000951 [Orobanche minor]